MKNLVHFDFDSLNIDNPLQVCQKYRNELQIPLRSIILINLAEMNSNNNQHMLIQAVKDLRDRNMDVYLLLVGKDCLDGECQEQASQLEVQQFVRFLGMRNDTGELLAASNIYVASSKTEKCPLGIYTGSICSFACCSNRQQRAQGSYRRWPEWLFGTNGRCKNNGRPNPLAVGKTYNI